jgi:hypothetical protein
LYRFIEKYIFIMYKQFHALFKNAAGASDYVALGGIKNK